MDISKETEAGQAIYTPKTLSLYDLWVLGFSNRFIWKCPTKNIQSWFDHHVTSNHCDIGVGTGYYLDHGRFDSEQPRIALMDLNINSLGKAASRIGRYQPECYQVDVLQPLHKSLQTYPKPFSSISLNYLFHCLPGNLNTKFMMLDYLKDIAAPNCCIFGSTILSNGVSKNRAAIKLMSLYNRKGIFSNADDSLENLEQNLNRYCHDVNIKVIGCVALFSGNIKS